MLRSVVAFIGIAMVSAVTLPAATQEPSNPSASSAAAQRTLLNRYCVTCHNEKLKTAGLMLDKLDVEKVAEAAPTWEKVIKKLRTYAMPPNGMPRPDKASYDAFATYLETSIDSAAAAKPNPGRTAVHRLNRAEYTAAIRDLLALEIDGEALLPADESGYGFDNNGDVLSASPMLLERYMIASRLITRLALGDPTLRTPVVTYDLPKLLMQGDRASEDLPFGTRGGIAIRHTFPLDGEYAIKIFLKHGGEFSTGPIYGLGEPHQLDVRLDGAKIKQFTVGGDLPPAKSDSGKPETIEQQEERKSAALEPGLEVRFPAKAGTRLIGIAFRDESVAPEGMLRPSFALLQLEGTGPKTDSKLDPGIGSVAIAGPFDAKGSGDTPSRRKVFVCRPAGNTNEELCAKKILSTLLRHAYRRPVTDRDVQTMLGFYKTGRSDGDFETGIALALQEMLVSPEFLFRIEHDPPNVAPGTPYRIGDLELASRLSFFLWSSIPDDQLIDLAARGKLKDNEVLQQQVRRMLRDPRSKALVDNFAGQWLYLRSIRSVLPDKDTYLEFDENLREAFEKETELFFETMLREDRTVPELLNSNFTFVNERLARHYGIPNIYGSRFRRVTLTDEARWGLLGKGSILTLTSFANRTSPVARGSWVLENILGTPPPPPPPNVPALQEGKDIQKLTMRQRMEQHRANPACATCHARMDPLGFALENFDGIGKWRTVEVNKPFSNEEMIVKPIDASGLLPDGTKFQGPIELRKILMSHPEQFVSTVAQKMLTYALGRGAEYYDQPALRQIMREAAASDYRWSSLILAIVKSAPFQMRMSGEQTTTTAGLR